MSIPELTMNPRGTSLTGRRQRRRSILAILAVFASLAWAGSALGADPPIISGGSPTEPTNVQPSYTITGVDGATIDWTLNGVPGVPGASPLNVGPLGGADGVYTLQATQTGPDPVSLPANVSFTLDTAGPAAPTIQTGPPAVSNVRDQSFTYSAAEAGGSFQYQLNGNTFTAGDSGVALANLVDGTYTFRVRQIDVAGNAGAFTADYAFSIDGTGPGAPSITGGPPAATNIRDWLFSYSASEAGGSFEYQLNAGTAVAAPAGGVTLTGLADGSYTFAVRQIDGLGNAGGFSAPLAFAIDGTSPVAPTLTAFPVALTNVAAPTFAWNGEASSTSLVQIVGPTTVAAAPATSPYVAPALLPGAYTFQVSQNDALGNAGPATALAFTVDTVPPTGSAIAHTPATNSLPGFARTTTVTVNLTAAGVDTIDGITPSGEAITYALTTVATVPAAADFSAWTAPRAIVVPATQGATSIFLWTRDAAGTGNVSAAVPLTPAVVYDTVHPSVAGTSFPVPGANVTTGFGTLANVQINFSEPVQIPVSPIRICFDPCGATVPGGVTFTTDRTGAILDPFPDTPTALLAIGTRYEVELPNLRDQAGNALIGPGSTSAWTFTTSTDGTPPGPVTKLALSPGIGQIALTWVPPGAADLARITVLRGTNPPASAADATAARFTLPATAKSLTDVGLTPGVTYHYAVYAEDAVGNPSALVRSSAVPLAPRRALQAVPKTYLAHLMKPKKGAVLRTLRPRLTWKPVKGAIQYNIQIWDGKRKVVAVFRRFAVLRVPKGRLKPGRRYTWHVFAYIGARRKFVKRPMTSYFDTHAKAKK